MEEYRAAVAKAQEALSVETNIGEQFDLAKEAIDIFEGSFDTFTNGVIAGTTDIEDAFENMVKGIILQLAKLTAQQFIIPALTGFLTPNAKGNVIEGGSVTPFARGGVVDRPTLFPMANGAGLMGEAGPEAIMPLGRNSRGELGVKGGGVNVVINNNAPGVEVAARDTGEGITVDVISNLVANSITQGGNAISTAVERTYSLNRGRSTY